MYRSKIFGFMVAMWPVLGALLNFPSGARDISDRTAKR